MFHILKFEYVDTKGKMFLGFAGLFAGPCNFALKNDLSITGSEFAAEFALKTQFYLLEETFNQVMGTAMGTRFAPPNANLSV